MKSLSNYIVESNVKQINEGFFKRLILRLLGFKIVGIKNKIKSHDWNDDIKYKFLTDQYVWAQRKPMYINDTYYQDDPVNLKTHVKDMDTAFEGSNKEIIKYLKMVVNNIIENIKILNCPEWCISQRDLLLSLSTTYNDKNGITLANKLSEAINKRWDNTITNNANTYINTQNEKIKNSGVLDDKEVEVSKADDKDDKEVEVSKADDNDNKSSQEDKKLVERK